MVLRDLGIPTDEAGLQKFRQDMVEARSLLEAFRVARHTVWVTAVKWTTGLILAAIAGSLGWHFVGK